MAVTPTVSTRMSGSNGEVINLVSIAMDSSYASGGEAITANACGLGRIDYLIPLVSTGGYIPSWDQANLKLKMFGTATLASISKSFTARADFTDGGSTSGYIDFAASSLPAGAIPVASQLNCTTAGSGDTSAVWQLGIAGDLDRYSTTTTNSCFTAIKTLSLTKTTGLGATDAAQTPRLTVTTATDFTAINTAFAGTATLFYIPSAGSGQGSELLSTTDLSAVTVTALVIGAP